MGCSPPSSWYDTQDRIYFARLEREKQEEIARTLKTVESMSDEDKARLKKALGI